ncbi:acyl carrier protein [Streptomyces sp. NBC_01244]|uniref:acyl carrier protein n=1 Tax=Streptomyces sp. NBC_01244 TaxID=2903797 RepID=UPI002E1291FD|nr:acyl carrier protein [Streptomyces sp. NBC_01244]
MTAPTAATCPEIADWLTGHLAALLEVATADIDPAVPLDALGVTSMEEVLITAELERRYGVAIPVADLRRHPTVESLSAYITGLTEVTSEQPPTP